ncbi:alpha/beta-hydrolase [Aspergillus heteromorphus CBS 117.55]|uniref:Alpha/beta-hydrolase n=1 Tax=Aspergillus heteromorphus CBS 117.55 TaxID=1448321 RepID=A0A317WQ68_9EURO|nr:alpha/beta-hydrolase [Aspergillus heteromorphus CBS 117.55]PWY87432.1 alpha/beta-hydrolase [Aspergillus heteromorphus CBS 117.55]
MESHFFDVSPETKIHYNITRASSSPSPLLVFIHYWGGSSMTWHKQTSPTSPHSLSKAYNTLSVDLRGWGQSTGPTEGATARDYSILHMASDIVALLTHLTTSPPTTTLFKHGLILIGHSMGAKVALATLSTLPTNLLTLTTGLVLLAPAPPTPLILPPEMASQQRLAYSTPSSVHWTITNVLSSASSLSDTDIKTITASSTSAHPLARDGWILHGMQDDITPEIDALSAQLQLTGRRMRVSVLAGELDVVEQKERVEREVVQMLRNRGFEVRFEVLTGVRHLIPLESPEGVVRGIEGVQVSGR